MDAIKVENLSLDYTSINEDSKYKAKGFVEWLKMQNLSNNTIKAYYHHTGNFFESYKVLNKANLLLWRSELIDNFLASTVNQYVQAINKYLAYIDKEKLRLKQVKQQRKSYLDDVISDGDYEFLKNKLKADNKTRDYFIIRFLGATGARVSEIVRIKIEHVKMGHYEILSKGGKARRIYIAKALQKEALSWLKSEKRESGYLFLSRYNEPLTTRSLSMTVHNAAIRYGIDSRVAHPHSFRHRFAKNFLAKCNDICLLADLLGHDNIETTRVYLRMDASEQRAIVDKVITW